MSRNVEGAAAVEFAVILPLLALTGVGFLTFGIALNNKSIVLHAAEVGIEQFSVSRGSSTPYSATVSNIQNAATGLTTSNLSIVLYQDSLIRTHAPNRAIRWT